MESPDSAERKWACVAVSNLIQNDPSTRRLLQGKNVVGALITRLSDSEEEVVIEAGGALRYVTTVLSYRTPSYLYRNLCVDGGYDLCAEMYNKNILAPLKTFIPKASFGVSLKLRFASGLTSLLLSDIYHFLAVYRVPKKCSGECAPDLKFRPCT